MSRNRTRRDDDRVNEIFECVADRRRRRILSILRNRDSPVEKSKLAAHLAAQSGGKRLVDVTREERERASVALTHADLPALDDAGLLEWDRGTNAVALANHRAHDDSALRRLLTADDPDVGSALRALAAERRRIALSILEGGESPTGTRTLAARVLERERGRAATRDPVGDVEDVHSALRHTHLPVLEDAGLLEYDPGEGVVAAADRHALPEGWIESELVDPSGPVLAVAE